MKALSLQQQLECFLRRIPQAPYPCQSRIHPLKSWPANCFVKREDELGFALTGSKVRKYRTLIPFFLAENIEQVIVIGSSHSNHVLGISQLLIENGILPLLFLKGDPQSKAQKGNFLFTRLLVDPACIHWISYKEWHQVESLAKAYAAKQPKKTFVLLEGASVPEAFPGALTLPLDVRRNEEEIGKSFDHILMDSGTGLTAISAILGYHWMKRQTHIHVVLIAGKEEDFHKQMAFYHSQLEEKLGCAFSLPTGFTLHSPTHAPSFGSTNQAIFKEIAFTARTEGFLVDPIYTAKLFLAARQILASQLIQGNCLIIHSGGGTALAGFQDPLQRLLT